MPNVLLSKAAKTVGFTFYEGSSFTTFSDDTTPLFSMNLMTKIDYKFGEEIFDADYNGKDHTLMAFYHSKSNKVNVYYFNYAANGTTPIFKEIGPLPDIPRKISIAPGPNNNDFVISMVYQNVKELRIFRVAISETEGNEEEKKTKFDMVITEDRPIFGVKNAAIFTIKESKKNPEDQSSTIVTYHPMLLYTSVSSSNLLHWILINDSEEPSGTLEIPNKLPAGKFFCNRSGCLFDCNSTTMLFMSFDGDFKTKAIWPLVVTEF